MKNKNALLGLLAIVFAIGSAFASRAFVPGQGHLKLKFVGEEEAVCSFIEDCPGGGFTCKASINGTEYQLRNQDCALANLTSGSTEPVSVIVDDQIEDVIE